MLMMQMHIDELVPLSCLTERLNYKKTVQSYHGRVKMIQSLTKKRLFIPNLQAIIPLSERK